VDGIVRTTFGVTPLAGERTLTTDEFASMIGHAAQLARASFELPEQAARINALGDKASNEPGEAQ
jgi:hypothetical protein